VSSAEQFGLDTPDVPIFPGMDEATRTLVGGTLHAARLVADGAADKVLQLGGGLHHAQAALASGFCVYNDLSVAIHHLVGRGLRVAYLDIDVHHGDGVQWLHYEDDRVLTVSLHESGRFLFPWTGGIQELGRGRGAGYALNVPLAPGTADLSYLDAFERVVPQALAWYRPDVLVVQCGSDAHYRDPLAHLQLTTHAYERLFRRILELADAHAHGRAVFTLGGGYDLDATTRTWALLYLVLQGHTLPTDVPSGWHSHWSEELGYSLSTTLHDPEDRITPDEPALPDEQNRRVAIELMERAAKLWSMAQ
jgi:acetoin utilization protein AcuC